MPASPSQLQLNSYYLKELSYVLKDNLEKLPEKKTDPKTVDLEIADLTVPLDPNGRKWRCELTIKSTNPEKEDFYEFRIVIIGFFEVGATLSSDTARLLAETNGPAVLYSTCREIVATVTRRSPYPGTLLPAVTFINTSPESVESVTAKKPPAKRGKLGKS